MRAPLTRRQIWGMPVGLAAVSTIGLMSGLLGDGLWDVLSWTTLSLPLLVTAWHLTHSHR